MNSRGVLRRQLTLWLAVGALAPGVAAQSSPKPAARLVLAPARLLVFQPLNASIELIGGAADSIIIEATHSSPGIRLEHERSAAVLQVHERRPVRDAAHRVRYRVTLPRETRIRVTVQAGDVLVARLDGEMSVGVADGAIIGRSLSGNVELSAVTGGVRLEDARGSIAARSVAGDVVITGVRGAVHARSTSGNIDILGDSAVVDAESYSGTLRFSGMLGPTRPSSFATHSGAIDLNVDPGAGLMLFVRSVRGREVTECTEAASHGVGAPLVLGAGDGARVEVISFSGDIRVRCAPADR